MSGLDAARRSRLRLWLRSERAFGVTSVRAVAPGPEPEAAAIHVAQRNAPPQSGRMETPAAEAPMPKRSISTLPPRSTPPSRQPTPVLPPITTAFDAPPLPREQKALRLKVMNDTEVSVCTNCVLHSTRTNTVFGEGDPDAKIF